MTNKNENPGSPIHEIWIPTDSTGEALAGLVRYQRRAARLGLPEVWATARATESRVETDAYGRARYDSLGRPYRREWTKFHVGADTLTLAGWRFIAKFDYDLGDTPVVMAVPGEAVALSHFSAASRRCDHCGHRRARKHTFLVRHEDGHEMIVGRTCLADFVGDASAVKAFFAVLCDLRAAGDEDGYAAGFRGIPMLSIRSVIAGTIAIVAEHGYLSGSQARRRAEAGEPTGTTTSALLWTLFRSDPGDPEEHAAQARLLVAAASPEVEAEAEATLAWARAEWADPSNEFETNMRTIAQAEAVGDKHFGYVAWMPMARQRAAEQAAEQAAQAALPASEYLGEVGDKLAVEGCVVTGCRSIEGHYGTTTLGTFRAPDGAILKWFASGAKDFEIGATVTVKGTVKKHEEYRGQRATMMTRCRVA